MESDKKKMLSLGIFLGLIILGSILFVIWNQFFDRGTLLIYGETPFTAQIVDEKSVECTSSPCEIKAKTGQKSLILSKLDREGVFLSPSVTLWATTELFIEFKIKPYIVETDQSPKAPALHQYSIIFDRNAQMQKLVNLDDSAENAIVYFQNQLVNPRIIPGEKYLLIFDKDIYKVDLQNKSRSKLAAIPNLKDAKWSPDGKYLIFSKTNSLYLWLLNENKDIIQLDIFSDLAQAAFSYDSKLIFLTEQSYSSEADSIKVLDQISSENITFGNYDPETNKYFLIESFANIPSVPEKLIPTASGNEIYFQIAEQNFKVVTKEF